MRIRENRAGLWRHNLPVPDKDHNKYDRGSLVILGAPELTGATRLAACAASRTGAGLVTVLGGAGSDIYRITLPADIMVRKENLPDWSKAGAMLGGSGGLTKAFAKTLFEPPKSLPRVLDADALGGRDAVKDLNATDVLTPHEGEFSRCFPGVEGKKEERAGVAAKACGACVVLKGAETIIAAPDGKVVANRHASPYLAKAGTGDVLAGMIAGFIVQGMEGFDAACAATWMHGEAALRFGPGLVAGDLVELIPQVLTDLLHGREG